MPTSYYFYDPHSGKEIEYDSSCCGQGDFVSLILPCQKNAPTSFSQYNPGLRPSSNPHRRFISASQMFRYKFVGPIACILPLLLSFSEAMSASEVVPATTNGRFNHTDCPNVSVRSSCLQDVPTSRSLCRKGMRTWRNVSS
jgi:hypothetical protein